MSGRLRASVMPRTRLTPVAGEQQVQCGRHGAGGDAALRRGLSVNLTSPSRPSPDTKARCRRPGRRTRRGRCRVASTCRPRTAGPGSISTRKSSACASGHRRPAPGIGRRQAAIGLERLTVGRSQAAQAPAVERGSRPSSTLATLARRTMRPGRWRARGPSALFFSSATSSMCLSGPAAARTCCQWAIGLPYVFSMDGK